MLTPEDKDLLVKKEFPSSRLQNNWLALKGFPILKLDAAASVEKGIMAPAENEMKIIWKHGIHIRKVRKPS